MNAFDTKPVLRRVCCGVVCLVAGIQGPALRAQEPPEVTVFSFADTSCAAWERSRDDEPLRALYGVWFRGFVSGYNFGNSANQVVSDKMPDPPALTRYVDEYCRKYPQRPFIGAAIPLVQSMREFAPAVPPAR